MLPSALPKKLGSGRLLWHSWEISSPTPFRAQKEGAACRSHADSMGCYGAMVLCRLMQTHADSMLNPIPESQIPEGTTVAAQISFNASISACEKCSQWTISLDLLKLGIDVK